MASSSNRDLINDLLVELRDGLGPVVERVLGPLVPANRLWTAKTKRVTPPLTARTP